MVYFYVKPGDRTYLSPAVTIRAQPAREGDAMLLRQVAVRGAPIRVAGGTIVADTRRSFPEVSKQIRQAGESIANYFDILINHSESPGISSSIVRRGSSSEVEVQLSDVLYKHRHPNFFPLFPARRLGYRPRNNVGTLLWNHLCSGCVGCDSDKSVHQGMFGYTSWFGLGSSWSVMIHRKRAA